MGEAIKKLKILMLEDMESDAGLVEWTLKKANIKFESKRVDTESEFREGIKTFQPDIILSDHSLPQFNSMDAFKICKEQNLDVPFILVTGTVSEEFAVTSLKDGIDDYILKSNLTRLPVALQSALKQRRLEKLKEKADIDLMLQNERLLKTNRELDNFAYNVSHNLKAPLVSVLGLINLIKIEDQKEGGRFMELIDLMKSSIDKLNLTLSNILNHSRNSRTDLQRESVDFNVLIERNYKDLQHFWDIRDIEIQVDVKQSIDFNSDKYRLDIIFNNLLSNSIKYTDREKPDHFIRINGEVTTEYADINIEDNGIGIKKDQLPKVFEMFTRGTEISDGSGLGLYIVKEMVDRMQGIIGIDSEEGKGTRITLRLPQMADENNSAKPD